MNTQKQIFLMVALIFVFVGGCAAYTVIDIPVRAPDQQEWHEEQSIERGALLYANNCRTCHGIRGEGGVGPQINKPEWQDQDPLVLRNNRAMLTRTLTCGRAGTLMPAWLDSNGGAFNERQIEHIVNFLTAPVSDEYTDDQGNPTSFGWSEAVHFAHNLNHHTALAVGGDTLATIATDHVIGVPLLMDLNPGLKPDQVLEKGTEIKLPPSNAFPDGRTYKVHQDRETLAKIADGQAVGAMAIADANGINYRFNAGLGALDLVPPEGNLTLYGQYGLFVQQAVKLPQGAQYIVRAGDTFESIAQKHNLSASELGRLNPDVETTEDDTLDSARKLDLPSDPVVVVQAGQTIALIATAHGVTADDILSANGLAEDAVPEAGQQLKLPAGTRYVVQTGDTLPSVAAAHGLSEADLANLNDLQPGDHIGPEVVIDLPAVDRYVVQGQTLEDIANTLSGVTADDLGETNGVPANALLQVGQPLTMPEEAWGSAPPDAKNPGTACVEFAVPNSVFQTLPGVGTGEAPSTDEPEKPAAVSADVTITAGPNDWTVVADGTSSEQNQGVALIAKGTEVTYTSLEGLHTITENGTANKPDIKKGDTRTITYNDAGTFKITCDYHPDMLAWLFVE